MRRARLTLVLPVLFALAAPIAAQEQQLGDVGGSIPLQHPTKGPVVIDTKTLPPAVPTPPVVTYREQLAALAVRYGAAVTELEATMGKLSSGTVLYDPAWQERATQACSTLEGIGIDLSCLTPPAEYVETHRTALEAAREYGAAAQVVRAAVASKSAAFDERTKHLAAGREALDRALQLAAQARFKVDQTGAPAPIVVYDAYATVDQRCAARGAVGSELYASCVQTQRAAVLALANRNPLSTDLDVATFNTLRNRCALQWPDDFEQRNTCELQALVAQPPR